MPRMRTTPAICPTPRALHHPHRQSLLILLLALTAFAILTPARAQLPSSTGRWTPRSLSLDSAGIDHTAIHMMMMRGDDDWQSNSSHFHSYLFWWENRHDECGNVTLFNGAMYGWNPGYNANCTDSMMASGFTRLPLNSELDPGYDVFCAGHTSLKDGRLLVIGGASAENSGVSRTSVFDRTKSGNKWTPMGQMALPRWYPTVLQTSDSTVLAYSGLQYARMHVVGGKPSATGMPRWTVGRQRLNSTGEWDADVLPVPDTLLTSGDKQPLPREYGTAPVHKSSTGLSRAVLFGGKDSTSGQSSVHSDVWWLLHKTDGGKDELMWWKFTGVSGQAPVDGLWKHAAITDSTTSSRVPVTRLWVFGGLDRFGGASQDVYSGERDQTDSTGRTWKWSRFSPSGGPGPRSLAACAFDPEYNRMIIYGGYDENGAVADSDVYALTLNATNPTWKKLTWSSSVSSLRPMRLAEAGLTAGPTEAEHLHGPSANAYLYGGADAAGTLHGEVWLMYFPDSNSVSWHKLAMDPATPAPSPRRGPSVYRDLDSWNLRVFGGTDASGAARDTVWMIDIYRNPTVQDCDTRQREWVAQGVHSGGGVIGGAVFPDPFEIPANTAERMTPPASGAGTWSGVANSPDRYQHFYPLLFTLPNGKVFDVTANLFHRPTFTLDLSTGAWDKFPNMQNPTNLDTLEGGSAVSRVLLDRTYEILRCGTKDLQSGPAQAATARIRIAPNGATSGWERVGDMVGRVYHNLVSLPTGEVLVTGGARSVDFTAGSNNNLPIYRPQIWSPSSGTWSDTTTLARHITARGYHSTALLMPDGRVLTGGGNDDKPYLEKHKFEVFCPPYRFSGSNPAVTPEITAGPTQLQFNDQFFVETDAVVSKVCLIRPGAVTHGFNPDQHYIQLTFQQCDYGVIATAPTSAYAPAGDYLLFVVNSAGVPSVGRWLRMRPDSTLNTSTYTLETCTGGGSGGGGGGGGGYYGDLSAHHVSGEEASAGTDSAQASYLENSLFAGSADGSIVRDRLALPKGPVRTASTLRVRLRHTGPGRDEYSRVRLVALDHAASNVMAADSAGEACGTRAQAIAMVMANGRDALADVRGTGGADGQSGDEMTAELGTGGEGTLWIETSGRVADDGGIRIESEVAGEWVESGFVTPREEATRSLVSGVTGSRVRLVFLGAHRVHGLGWFHTAATTPVRTELAPVGVTHTRDGQLAADSAIQLANGDTAYVDFAPLPAVSALTRDWYLEVDGRPVGYKPSGAALSARHIARPEGRPAAGTVLKFAFTGAVPNPFTSSTRLAFELPSDSDVRVEIFDPQGRRVRKIVRHFVAGRQMLDWNRTTERGVLAAPGVYQVRLIAGEHVATRSVVVLP